MYTIDDVKNKVKALGWDYNTALSDADRKLAEQNPDAGMSIVNYKLDWQNAETDEQRLRANEGANRIREQYGSYTANDSGEGFYSVPSAPTYKGTYDDQYDALLQQYVNTPSFSYNAEQDPLYSSYKKTYAREGQRATQDTMASAAAMTGGLPSSYAVGAAQQAGNVYSAAMADKVPELYKLAYDKYLNELDIAASKVSMVGNAMNTEYGRYLDSWNQYNTDRNYYAGQEQQAIDNAYRDRQYADKMEQQRLENELAAKEYADAQAYREWQMSHSGNEGGTIETEQPDSSILAEAAFRKSGKDFRTWAIENMFNYSYDDMVRLASVYLPDYDESWYSGAYQEALNKKKADDVIFDFVEDNPLLTPPPIASDVPSEFVDIYTKENNKDSQIAGLLDNEKKVDGDISYWQSEKEKWGKVMAEKKAGTKPYLEALDKWREAVSNIKTLEEQAEYDKYMEYGLNN